MKSSPDPAPSVAMSGEHAERVVLVTGASAGLGLALSRQLLNTPYRLILTARLASLHRFAREGISESPRVWLRALNVTSDTDRQRVVKEANERWGGVDTLINNAGAAYRSVIEHATEEEFAEQLGVNFFAAMELIRLVLPGMRTKRNGHIINISSVGGMMAMPTMGLYSASKFALEGATESLWYEMRPLGIRVSLIEPGFIHSTSFQNTRYTAVASHSYSTPSDPYYKYYHTMANFVARRMNMARATPDDVAAVILRTMRQKKPQLRVPATIDAKVFEFFRRFLPRQFYHRLLYHFLPEVRSWADPAAAHLPQPHSDLSPAPVSKARRSEDRPSLVR